MLNALIGMAQGSPGWPNVLQQHGYELRAIERDVAVRVGTTTRVIRPEAVFVSPLLNASLVVEAKSATLGDKQYAGYAALDGPALDMLGVLGDCDPTTHTVDTGYFTPAYHVDELAGRMVDLGRSLDVGLPLVGFDNHRFKLATGAFEVSELHDPFKLGVAFHENRWPLSFIPFGPDSSSAEFVGPLSMTLAQLLLSDEVDDFTAAHIAQGHDAIGTKGIVPHHEFLGPDSRKRYRGTIVDLVEEMRINYLADYFVRTGPQSWVKSKRLAGVGMAAVNRSLNEYADIKRQGWALPASRVSTDVRGQTIAGDDEGS